MPAGIVSSNRFQIRFDRAIHADTQAVHAPLNTEAERPGFGSCHPGPGRQDLDHRSPRGLGGAPQGSAFDPGDRRQFYLRRDRRSGISADDQTGRAADLHLERFQRSGYHVNQD
jgi:hypothetical protein